MTLTTLRHPKRVVKTDALLALTGEQLSVLWAAYVADRSDLRLRNRLVEHYLPWVSGLAAGIARRMRLRDKDNAVGEVLVLLVSSIVPGYDGKSGFERWAQVCTRRKMIDQRRTERQTETTLGHVPEGSSAICSFELVPDREQLAGDLKFLDITAELSDRQALVLWLRYYRGMSVEEVAETLGISDTAVKDWSRVALAGLKIRWANCPREELPAY